MKLTTTKGNKIEYNENAVTIPGGKTIKVLNHGNQVGGYVLSTEIGDIQLDKESTKAIRAHTDSQYVLPELSERDKEMKAYYDSDDAIKSVMANGYHIAKK